MPPLSMPESGKLAVVSGKISKLMETDWMKNLMAIPKHVVWERLRMAVFDDDREQIAMPRLLPGGSNNYSFCVICL